MTIRLEKQFKALQMAPGRETTSEYQEEYAYRAGIEGTLSETVRAHGLRHARYIGLVKTHFQHLMTATAINVKRIFKWQQGTLHAVTRISQFAKLMEQATG